MDSQQQPQPALSQSQAELEVPRQQSPPFQPPAQEPPLHQQTDQTRFSQLPPQNTQLPQPVFQQQQPPQQFYQAPPQQGFYQPVAPVAPAFQVPAPRIVPFSRPWHIAKIVLRSFAICWAVGVIGACGAIASNTYGNGVYISLGFSPVS
jgi:hypothetical protein